MPAKKGMSSKKTVTPRKIMPPQFIVTDERGSNYGKGGNLTAAVSHAVDELQDKRGYGTRHKCMGVYQLVKVLRPKEVPVEVEDVSCCKPCEEE